MQAPGAWVAPLTDPICHNPELVGGKAAQLHRLIAADFAVPPAWVITRDAFDHHFPEASPHRQPAAPQLDLAFAALLAEVGTSLADAYRYLAVRSSAVGEDGTEHSFAGQHATYYYITAATLQKAVIDCWQSLWSAPALAYRNQLSADAEFGMAVIIQEMVQADRAGVCFSHDPTGRHEQHTLIEATWGLGAALVDGRVSPDRYWLDQELTLVDTRIGHKRLKVAADLQDPSGARLEPVPAQQRSAAVLLPEEAQAVAAVTRRAAELFEGPQDLEWAYAGEVLQVLQSRPVTGVNREHPHSQPDGRWVLFKPIVENVSGPLTPITVDIFRHVLPPTFKFIRGRLYIDADSVAQLLPLDLNDGELRRLLLLRAPAETLKINWRRLPRTLALGLVGYLAAGVSWHRSARVPLSRLADFAQRCTQVLDDESINPLQALTQLFLPRNPFLPISHLAFQLNVSAERYFLLIGVLKKFLLRYAPDIDSNSIQGLLSGDEEMLSRQMVEAVRRLADTARADPAVQQLLSADGSADRQLQRALGELDDSNAFVLAYRDFISRFGHRAIGEVELMTPRWREDSAPVVQMVANYLTPGGPRNHRIDPHGLRLASEDKLHQALQHRWQRRLVDRLVRRIRFYVTLRENTRYFHTMAFATVRAKLLQWEQTLISEQRLRCPNDVFFLEWPELLAMREGRLGWRDVEPRILNRRQRYQRESSQIAQESFNMAMPQAPAPGDSRGLFRGDCASPGTAEGRARVILDPAVGMHLEPGEILVAPYTDPAWTPLFPGAAAVVVEVGSYLSHAGTVAREYQIPCLVDVDGITRKVRSGQRLRVNATEGWIELLEKES